VLIDLQEEVILQDIDHLLHEVVQDRLVDIEEVRLQEDLLLLVDLEEHPLQEDILLHHPEDILQHHLQEDILLLHQEELLLLDLQHQDSILLTPNAPRDQSIMIDLLSAKSEPLKYENVKFCGMTTVIQIPLYLVNSIPINETMLLRSMHQDVSS